ncbi:MAG TPA: TonB-dependent receptor [Gemmatimonadaceae bacterium]|nr:TonB-dependent receptor [Gemmatimonadaceae bacterium]
MKRVIFAILSVSLMSVAPSVNAQAPAVRPPQSQPPVANGEVRGVVTDGDSNTPLARATIAVRTKGSATLVAGAVAKGDGTFRIQGLRPGIYYLRVTTIGYGPRSTEEFTITPAALAATLAPVKLSKVAVALEGVQVTAERAAVAIEPDRNTYNSKQVAPTATNASDVLDAVPSVQVDGDGKVSLRGNENVAIQINGRPTPIAGAQLGAYLKQIPASIVDRVEVVPTPSARYDPEGMAGIINIVLKANADLGMSAGVTVGSATVSGRYNGSGNLGYQSGPWTTFTTAGYNSDDRGIAGINNRERYLSGSPLSFTNSDVDGRNGNNGFNITQNVDYKLLNNDVVTNALAVNVRKGTDNSLSAYTELNGAGAFLSKYNRTRDDEVKSYNLDYTLAWKRTLEPRKHELSTELRLNRSHDDDNTLLWRQPLTATGTVASGPLEGERDVTGNTNSQANAQIDYMKTLRPRTKIETGFKGTARWLDKDFQVTKDALGNGTWLASNLSNQFSFNDQVGAVYGVLSQGAGKFDLQGGLRAEYANRDFSLKNSTAKYPYSYTSLFPSAVALYKWSDMTQGKIAYSRRIRRPGTQELNPFPTFFDVQNVFIGNPKLNPEYTDAIEFGLTRTGQLGTFQLSPFYRHTSDIIRVAINTADVVDGREVTSVSFQNLATSNSYGTDVNGSFKLGRIFNGLASFNVFKQVTDGGSLSSLSSNAVTWSTRYNGTFTVNPDLTLQGSYFYRAPVKIERGEFSSTQMANFSVRQKLLEGKGAVSLRVQDPFNTMRFKIRTGDDNLIQFTERQFGVRAVFLTFQYNFGQTPKFRVPKQDDQPQAQTGFPPP